MKGMSGEELERLAAQAMLAMDPQERQDMARSLGPLLRFLDQGEGAQAPAEPPESPVLPEHSALSCLRPDIPQKSLPLALVLANAPRAAGGFIQLPGVLE